MPSFPVLLTCHAHRELVDISHASVSHQCAKNNVTAILFTNLETLVSISPSPMLIWVSQWSQCFKIRLAQHWGGRRHISRGKTVWSTNVIICPENSRGTVSDSTICEEYCGQPWLRWPWIGHQNMTRLGSVDDSGHQGQVSFMLFCLL